MGNIFRREEYARGDFVLALVEGDLEKVQELIQYATQEETKYGLHVAARRGHLELVRFYTELCDAGVTVIGTWQDSALSEAATSGQVAVVQYLAERCQANLNVSKALVEAASRGHVDVVQYLAERCGADVNAKDDFERTALVWAAHRGDMRLARYLVEQCAVNVSANALIEGASSSNLNVVQYFVKQCGVDVNMEDEHGQTAVMVAITNREIDVVRYLVEECSADVNSTAVRFAANRGYIDIQRILTPFLLPEAGDTTTDGGDVVLSPDISSRSSIPPSEMELTLFHENGSIGGDFLAKWLDADVAVKLFIPDASSTSFEDEVRLWQQLRHPNVLKMYGACDAGPRLKFFVCEYASNGSLLEHVNSSSVKKITMWKYLYEAALGLEFLHERGIVHAELRCSNILIGSDGKAKLTNFQLRRSSAHTRTAGSVHWQSPEVMSGNPPSRESDVYSLGMCILEAATGKMPWSKEKLEGVVRYNKRYWTPEDESEQFNKRVLYIGNKSYWATEGGNLLCSPACPPGDARELVWGICRQDPRLRPSLSSIIYKLGNLAIKESSNSHQPENEPIRLFDEYERCNVEAAWLKLERLMAKPNNAQYRREFAKLENIHEHLQASLEYQTLLKTFHELLVDFTQMIKMSPEQARLMQLSSSRVTNTSVYAFQWRIQSLMASLGETGEVATEGETRWQQQRHEQIEQFMSGVSDTFLLLNALKTVEERSAFLRKLKEEMETAGKYTTEQLEVMKKAYAAITNKLEGDDWSELTPAWFIPWYELVIDEGSRLGKGAFGRVHRAKWLDSDVVVKRVILAGSTCTANASTSYSSFSASEDPSATQVQEDTAKRAEARAMFRREVDIWFGFSHPHVVRLFGACHVGRPFFVCEYAANGTLVSYLRTNADELWSKLHEAALGVQYLHARGVVHGDLKGNNIVVGSDMKAKVTDFSLSWVGDSEEKTLVSAAWHWVAPELLDTNQGTTLASDVYSLGMCIVEALRVVEAVKSGKDSRHCVPWRVDDRAAMKYHATRGSLPGRPSICEDSEWELVERMCVLDPAKRIKISTVVDELAKLASCATATSQANGHADTSRSNTVEWESVPQVIAATRMSLAESKDDVAHADAVIPLYGSLWERLGQVQQLIDSQHSDACRAAFGSFVTDADTSTKKLRGRTRSLISLAETTMRCHALHRALTKFCEAHFI
ncbi:hypothetical protein PF008_g5387 [Phytophthora fragariae]|uniref:Protein kinase domain-containing protein n=2 Tax=Phytophthora fragariae TaxID=53985 RepID=A0A6G0S8H5_9STRA|nr:hypothetical protein PF008_g5387 [Phytophthora fragariae]